MRAHALDKTQACPKHQALHRSSFKYLRLGISVRTRADNMLTAATPPLPQPPPVGVSLSHSVPVCLFLPLLLSLVSLLHLLLFHF